MLRSGSIQAPLQVLFRGCGAMLGHIDLQRSVTRWGRGRSGTCTTNRSTRYKIVRMKVTGSAIVGCWLLVLTTQPHHSRWSPPAAYGTCTTCLGMKAASDSSRATSQAINLELVIFSLAAITRAEMLSLFSVNVTCCEIHFSLQVRSATRITRASHTCCPESAPILC